ncbi:MAG: VCBS repeat-containing protein [Flavobacteriales bacterium]|nr:VCBS repeat-containing protein [Flavobacteriales bacterium]
MRKRFSLLLAFAPLLADAQLIFGPERVVAEAETANAKAVEAGDMDGDGDADIVVASANDNEISIYANIGGGNFAEQQVIISDAGGAIDVELGDIDNDGDLDIAFAAQLGDRFAWLRNNGGLQFAAPIDIVPAFYANCAMDIELSDVDLDGDLDAVTAMCAGPGYVMWWTNSNAGASWGGVNATIASTTAAVCVAVGPMDADNYPDVLAGGAGLVWRLNLGEPFFGDCGCDNSDQGDPDITSVAIGPPINGFSQEYYASAENDIVWNTYRPLDDPEFQQGGAPYMQVLDPCFVDVTPLGVIVLSNTTHSAYLNGSTVPIITDAYGARDVAVADFDGDGDEDIVIASSLDCDITWYENSSTGFAGHRLTPLAGTFGKPIAADLNGDALPDVTVLQAEGLTWYPNQGMGNFGPAVAVDLDPLLGQMDVADMDGDGDQDLITLSDDGTQLIEIPDLKRIEWHPNNGAGNYGAPVLLADTFPYTHLEAADMDGDGDTDIITGDYSPFHRTLLWIANNGDGTPGDTTCFGWSGGLLMFQAFDADDDGDTDVILVDQQLDAAIVHLNNGDGSSFNTIQAPGLVFGPTDLAHGDLNSDGITDIAITINFGAELRAHYGTGGGNFAAPVTLWSSPTNSINSFDIADLDGDNDDDVAMSKQDPGVVSVVENLGNGSWGTAQDLEEDVPWSQGLSITDVGGDAQPDILLTSPFRHAIVWFANDDVTTGIHTEGTIETMHVWPVPARTVLHLDRVVNGAVQDSQGRIVDRIVGESTIDLRGYATGCYTLRTQEGVAQRFVVQGD